MRRQWAVFQVEDGRTIKNRHKDSESLAAGSALVQGCVTLEVPLQQFRQDSVGNDPISCLCCWSAWFLHTGTSAGYGRGIREVFSVLGLLNEHCN